MRQEQLKQWRESGREMLAAAMAPASVNGDERTVDCVWFTGADVARVDWYSGDPYTLKFDPDGVDLSLLNNGAPVLDSHDDWEGCAGQLGRVDKAWVGDNGQYMGTLRFSRRPEVDGIWRDIQDGIVSKFSMGVSILSTVDERDENGRLMNRTATKWQPFEISPVPIPADFGTTTLSAAAQPTVEITRATAQKEAPTMENPNTDAGVEARKKQDEALRAAAIEEGVRMERERQQKEAERLSGIDSASATFLKRGEVKPEFIESLKTAGKSVDQVKLAIIEEMAKRSEADPIQSKHPANLEITRDERMTAIDLMSNALLNRFQPGVYKLEDDARQYRSMSLLRLSEECLTRAGVNARGMSRDEIATAALSGGGSGTFNSQFLSGVGGIGTSDLPFITANVANKVLRRSYEADAQTFKVFSRQATSSDFKQKYITQFGDSPTLDLVNENGEFKYGKIGDSSLSYGLKTYGKILPFTRQAIINDDSGAFTRIPELEGKAAARKESDLVWGLITSNPTMGDGYTLFSSQHGNLISSGTAISVDSMGIMRANMRVQKGLSGTEQLNLVAKYILLPAAKEQIGLQYTGSGYTAATAGTVNPYAGLMTPVVEPRLDAASTTAWYMVADPAQVDTLEYSYLDGQEGPYLETRVGWDIDGMEFKCRLDFGAAIIDWRSFVKNNGA